MSSARYALSVDGGLASRLSLRFAEQLRVVVRQMRGQLSAQARAPVSEARGGSGARLVEDAAEADCEEGVDLRLDLLRHRDGRVGAWR